MRQLSDIVCRQNPVTLPATATVKEACRSMRTCRVGAVLVVAEDGSLKGIFTGRDAVCRVLAEGKSAAKTRLSEVMTQNPSTMPPGKTALEALRLMWDGGFRHVPLVEAGKVAGVVSRGDFKGFEQDRFDEERQIWEHMR